MLSKFQTVGAFILDLVFPMLCLECGLEGSYLCAKCGFRLSMITKEQVCAVCAQPSAMGMTHPACSGSLVGFIHALRYKEDVVRRLVESIKYQGVSSLGPICGQIIFQEILNQGLEKYFSEFVIIPLPLHPKRLRWRGYNQAGLIGYELARLLNLPYLPELLKKVKHSSAQATLNKQQRQQNPIGAFEAQTAVADQNILLIDDVATTRSTLMAAALELKKAQAKSVWALTLAYED